MALIVNGTNTSGGSSAAPTTPAGALLDAGSPLTVVILDESGEGAATSFEDVATTGLAEALAADAEGDFIVGNGAGEIQRASVDPAAVRVVIGAASASVADYDFSNTTGWTLSALDGATAAFASNLATFTVPAGVHLAAASRPRASIPLATVGVANPWRIAAEARLAAFDASGLRRAAIVLSSVPNGLDAALYGSSDVGVFLFALGSTIAVWDITGGASIAARVTSNQTLSLDGQDWLRIEMRGPDALVYYGRGATRPTAWSLIASCTAGGTNTNLVMNPLAYLTIGGYRSDTTASVFTVSWADLRVTDLP